MKKKKICVLLFLGIILLVFLMGYFIVDLKGANTTTNNYSNKNTVKLSEYVITNDVISLYYLDNNKYVDYGEIGENVVLHIDNTDDDYYRLIDFEDDYYVKSNNLSNYEEVEEKEKINDRYKKYIVFNKNVNTNGKTEFYDEEGDFVFSINKSMSLPIIIMKSDKVGVEYNNQLLYINLNNSEIIDSNNTDDENIDGVGALNYHFFYDDNDVNDTSKCNQDICTSLTQFKEHLDYIKNNNYFTPTMSELEMYIDGEIQLPKSVVITIDDGWRAELGIKMLTEYELNATIFVVTSWYDASTFKTEYVETHSHSDNLHNTGDCPTGQGGGIQCLSEDVILSDLKSSKEKLGGSNVFCYPFYEYNDYSISMLKKAGFTMAFAGESTRSYNMIRVGSDKFRLPRFVVVSYTSMNDFSKYLSGKFYS